jgi:hypothetical protein
MTVIELRKLLTSGRHRVYLCVPVALNTLTPLLADDAAAMHVHHETTRTAALRLLKGVDGDRIAMAYVDRECVIIGDRR